MSRDSSLAWSYHSAKLWVGLGVVLVAGIAFILSFVSSEPGFELAGSIGAVVLLLALLVLGYTVTCPRCQLRLLFHSMRTQGLGNWVGYALYEKRCPRCGLSPNDSDMSSNTSLERAREE